MPEPTAELDVAEINPSHRITAMSQPLGNIFAGIEWFHATLEAIVVETPGVGVAKPMERDVWLIAVCGHGLEVGGVSSLAGLLVNLDFLAMVTNEALDGFDLLMGDTWFFDEAAFAAWS